MNNISIQLPEYIFRTISDLSKKENISIDQFVTLALAEKLSAFMTEDYLTERANRGLKEKYMNIISRAPDNEPEQFDKF